MEQGHEVQAAILRSQGQVLLQMTDRGAEIGLTQRDLLRASGGARGMQDERDILGHGRLFWQAHETGCAVKGKTAGRQIR